MLVWFETQRGMKNGVCDGLVFVCGTADGLLCARDRLTSRCGCSGGPVCQEWNVSRVKQSTTRLTFAWLASVSGTCHVQLGELPDLNNKKSKTSLEKALCRILVFLFNLNQTSKCRLVG